MNSKSNAKEKPALVRQKSMVENLSRQKLPMNRSKTPPPRLNSEMSTSSKDENSFKTSSRKNAPTASCISRNRPPAARSVEELNFVNPLKGPVKPSKDILTREDVLALRYNAYLQSCLLIAHSKKVTKRKENKIVHQLEDMQTKLLEIDDKMNSLKINVEKLKLYKQMKEKLTKEINDFEDLNNAIDINRTEEQIKILENDLSIIQLNNFYIPTSVQASGEITQCLERISEDLKLLPDLQKKTLPLTNLHSSLTKTRENIHEEEILRKECEKKLKEAEELLVHDCYSKSLKV